jgi:serine O-acetyltransferase
MWRELAADVRRYPGAGLMPLRYALASPGFWAVATYRVHRAVYGLPWPLRPLAKLAVKPTALAVTLATGVELPPGARIGAGLYVGHHGGIIVSCDAVIGERCNLSQGVTIGVADDDSGRRGAPRVGDRVYLALGAKVFGPIRVGRDVAVGANAVVHRDVPDGVTVAGVPARVVSTNGSRHLIDLGRDPARPLRA